MADAVTNTVIRSGGRYHVIHLTSNSDGTGEAGVVKVDISTLLTAAGRTPVYSSLDRIEYSVWGMDHVTLAWDHTTDDVIAQLSGSGVADWQPAGGKVDPRSSGGTGDVLLTTNGATASGGYDITIWLRLKV